MRHDLSIGLGCGQDGDKGHMSGTHNRWSTCSKNEFLDLYNFLQPTQMWCLAPLPESEELECEDSGKFNQEKCAVWVDSGFCEGKWEKFMLAHCKKSCGRCGEVGKIYSKLIEAHSRVLKLKAGKLIRLFQAFFKCCHDFYRKKAQ